MCLIYINVHPNFDFVFFSNFFFFSQMLHQDRDLRVLCLELLHERRECLRTLDGHRVVDGRAHTTHAAVSLERHHAQISRLGDERLLKLRTLVSVFVHDRDRDVHRRAARHVDGAVEEAVGSGNGIVDVRALLDVHLLHSLESAHLVELVEHQASHVDGVARRRVVHGVVLRHDGVVLHRRAVRTCVSNKVVAHNHNRESRRSDILLRAGVDDSVLGHVDGLGDEVGRHVGDERRAVRRHDVGLELNTLDRLVCADVHVLGVV
mmetsp:Transcript_4745/g.10614  ORF Transcript_4745/g.10614 Transcript_4745/m.10614 type:complete len:263 (-) Transcript_4745:577-1365(-)